YIREKLQLRAGQQTTVPLPLFWVGGMIMYLLPNWVCGAITGCTEGTSTNSRFAMGVVLADDDAQSLPAGKILWALGMTETLGPYSYGDEARVAGYPLCAPLDHIADGFEVRVVDAEGRGVADGETGEIQVRGYALTPGLHKVEKSRYFTADGFYRTGDMGTVLDGRILFVGRDGDMIKTVGSNVSPAEVELEIQRLPDVHSAYVVGIPDSERGQLVVAAVVPRDEVTVDFELARKILSQRLSSYKVPREYVAIARDEVPMLPSNKVSRRGVEALVAKKLGRKPR
ncbi:MAG: fatty acid--CoA ligase family protein, partial [Bacteroidales bacterium]|nr:fatty acid--CoA ligase family protein [Bacteroidales bacterium]